MGTLGFGRLGVEAGPCSFVYKFNPIQNFHTPE